MKRKCFNKFILRNTNETVILRQRPEPCRRIQNRILRPAKGGTQDDGEGLRLTSVLLGALIFSVLVLTTPAVRAADSSGITVTVTIDRISIDGLTLTFSDDGRIDAIEHPTLGRWSREDNAAVVNAYEKVRGDDYEITSGELWAVVGGLRVSLGRQQGDPGYDAQYDLDDSGMIVSRDVGLLRLLVMLTTDNEQGRPMLAALQELRIVTGFTVDPVPPYVKRAFVTLRGAKPSGATIWINRDRAEEWMPDLGPLLGRTPAPVTREATKWSYFIELPDVKKDGDTQILSVAARDEFGNESRPVEIEVTLDQTKPSFSLSTPIRQGDTVPNTGFRLEGTANDEHLTAVLISLYYPRIGYRIYNEPAAYDRETQIWRYDLRKDALIEGQAFGLSIYAYDRAGNKTGTYLPLKVEGAPDATPPNITLTSHISGQVVSYQDFLLSGIVKDNEAVSRIYLKFFDPESRTYRFHPTRRLLGRSHLADYDPESGTWSFPLAQDQLTPNHPILIYFRAADTRGNISPWQSVEVFVA